MSESWESSDYKVDKKSAGNVGDSCCVFAAAAGYSLTVVTHSEF